MNFLTVKEFAEILKVNHSTIRRGIRSGRIFAMRVGDGKKSSYRIATSELERLYLQGLCERKDSEGGK